MVGETRFFAHTPTETDGKWHDLVSHLKRVAKLAHENASKFGAGELGQLAGLWHDIGKFNPAFQEYLKDCYEADLTGKKAPRGGSVPHAVYGAILASEQSATEAVEWLVPVIYGHHAGLPDRDRYSQALQNSEFRNVYDSLLPATRTSVEEIEDSVEGELLSRPPTDLLQLEVFIRMVFSALVDADFIDTEGHFEPEASRYREIKVRVDDLLRALNEKQEEKLSKAEPTKVNGVRREVYEACLEAADLSPGVFRLSVPTGGGKTRSGLSFALRHAVRHGMDRVVVAAPYTSILDQTASEYRRIFESLGDGAILEHHSAVRRDEERGGEQPDDGLEEIEWSKRAEQMDEARTRARLATQNWDAPLIVTTTVQLFESLFANRTSRCRKLHNLAKSVIVLDEVQTLPLGLLEPIVSVLEELVRRYHISVVLCTATQPALEERSRYMRGFSPDSIRDIVLKEAATGHFFHLQRVEYKVEKEPLGWGEVARKLLDRSPERRALAVLNSRRDALSVLDALEDEAEFLLDGSIKHLSTLLCGAHRKDVLRDVRERLAKKKPCLLVSTQVVEAGVDLDFPVVFRAVGPLDRIVQAAGRCNREGLLDGLGQVVVFEPRDGGMPRGEYASAVGITRVLLKEHVDLHNPDTFRRYFSDLYRMGDQDAKGIQRLREKLDYPEVASRFRFIESPTEPVIVEYEERDPATEEARKRMMERIRREGLLRSGDHRRLQPYTVGLFSHDLRDKEWMLDEIADGVRVWTGAYDDLRGISVIRDDPADLVIGP